MVGFKRKDSTDSLLIDGPRSEYVKRYQVYSVQKTQSYKPTNEPARRDVPIDSETVFRRDFPEHLLPKRQTGRPAAGNLKPEGGQDFTSSYQNEFPERLGERRKPYKPDTIRPQLATFDAQPSYREDYQEWELPKKHQQDKQQWHAPVQPFEGNTTSMNDFKEHYVSPRVNHKPEHKPMQSDSPFNASSDYRDTYREHPLPPKVQRERDQWTKPKVPLDDMTTQQKDYRGEYAPRQKSMKPETNIVKSDVPIEGDTTTSITYQPHDLPQRYRHQPEKYKQPEGFMDLNTTNSTHFKEHTLQRQELHKPSSSNIMKGSGEMVKDTNYNKDYLEYPIDRVAQIKPKNEYSPPTLPMESQTEYQADFHGHQLVPRHDYKPKDAPLHSNQPIDDRTDYRDKFIEHKITPREQRPKEVYLGPSEPLDSRTTAGESYLGPYQPRLKGFKPDFNPIKSDIPFDSNTTMNTDFKMHDVKRREMHKADPYQKPEGDIDLTTSHSLHYKEHPLQQQRFERPESSGLLKGTGEMANKTNYQGDFIELPINRQKMIKPTSEYQPSLDPMTTETTHRSHFFEHQLQERQSYKPKDSTIRSEAPLDNRTGYRDSFVQHTLPPREIRPRELHQPPSAPFEDRTTVRDSYLGPVLPKRESFRPNLNVIKSTIPLEGSTTTNTDFREHQIPKRFQHKYESYQRPEGQMDLTTTHTTNYIEHAIDRQKITKPESSGLLRGFGEMRKETNYQGDYREPPAGKREIFKAKHDYVPPSAPMASTTTNQTSYQEHSLAPRISYRPKNEYLKPEVPLNDRTDYMDKFVEHAITPRNPKVQEIHKPPAFPLDSRTTTNEAFTGVFQPQRKSFRPDRQYTKSDVPIENDTTFSTAFKQWPVGDRHQHKQDQYVKPDGFMDLTTVNRESYKAVQGDRAQKTQVTSSNLFSQPGKFDNTTSYSKDFVAKSLENRMRVRPENQYTPSSMPLGNETEYRVAHIGYVAPKERSLKPERWSDALGQRDPTNPYHIRPDNDWRQQLKMVQPEAVVKG